MQEGDVALTPLPQADGVTRQRPAILLRQMPRFGDYLVCGVSTRLHQYVEGFDELLLSSHEDFAETGLLADSVIRLGFLAVVPQPQLAGSIGRISPQRHRQLLEALSAYLLRSRPASG